MKKLSKIAELLNYDNWDEIKKEFIRVNNIQTFSAKENKILLMGKYKNYKRNQQISYLYLKNAIKILKNNKKISLTRKIDFFSTRQNKLKIKIGNEIVSPSDIRAFYNCIECNKIFKVECNFAKWIKYFHGPVCKNCKKKIVTKTNTYREKYKESMTKIYGVNFPLQSQEIRKNIKNTMIERYGVEYSGQSRELLLKSWKNTLWKNKISKLERSFAKTILEKIDKQARTCLDDQKRPKIKINNTYRYPDVLIKNKYIIELYGDYWHGNPFKYSENYVLPSGITVKQKWEKDKKRIDELKSINYEILIIWEKDWLDNQIECLNKIKDFIK